MRWTRASNGICHELTIADGSVFCFPEAVCPSLDFHRVRLIDMWGNLGHISDELCMLQVGRVIFRREIRHAWRWTFAHLLDCVVAFTKLFKPDWEGRLRSTDRLADPGLYRASWLPFGVSYLFPEWDPLLCSCCHIDDLHPKGKHCQDTSCLSKHAFEKVNAVNITSHNEC